jgi:hypothetical protein
MSPFNRITSMPRRRTKAVLDRRYATQESLAALVLEVHSITDRLEKLERRLCSTSTTDDHVGCPGAAYVGREDPHALRKKTFEASRLAVEASIAVEHLLREDVLLWQAVDGLAVNRPRKDA